MLLEKFRCRCTDKSLDRIVFIKHCSSLLEMDWCSLYVSTGLCWQVHIFWGEGNGTPLQYSCLENPMHGGAWWAAVHGVAEGWIWLSDFTLTFHFHALEKEMAAHSSVLAWRIPGTGEPGGLLSMGSHRVRHNWNDLAVASILAWRIPWTEEPGGLQSMGSQRIRHDWVTNTFTLTLFNFT